MTALPEHTHVTMVNEQLARVPTFDAPSPDLSVHWYEPGDEDLWIAIHDVADTLNKVSRQLFFRQFPTDGPDLHDRQCYLVDAHGQATATGTAWVETHGRFRGYGRVHWIAVIPSHQGRGVGGMLMSIVCKQLLSLGHTQAFLTTDTRRPAAIHLYKKFGFELESANENKS